MVGESPRRLSFLGIPDGAGFVDAFAGQSDVGGGREGVPIWNTHLLLIGAEFGDLTPFLRGVIFIGEPANFRPLKIKDLTGESALDLPFKLSGWHVGDADGLLGLVGRHAGRRGDFLPRLNFRAVAHPNVLVGPLRWLNLLQQFASAADSPSRRSWVSSILWRPTVALVTEKPELGLHSFMQGVSASASLCGAALIVMACRQRHDAPRATR